MSKANFTHYSFLYSFTLNGSFNIQLTVGGWHLTINWQLNVSPLICVPLKIEKRRSNGTYVTIVGWPINRTRGRKEKKRSMLYQKYPIIFYCERRIFFDRKEAKMPGFIDYKKVLYLEAVFETFVCFWINPQSWNISEQIRVKNARQGS